MKLRLHPRVGLAGAVAIAALLLALPLAGVLAPRWQAEAERLASVRPPVLRPVAQAPAAVLPALGDSHLRVAELLERAADHGVVVLRTQQRTDTPGPVRRLQLSINCSGSYAALRAFVAAALQADDGLALDRLRLRRNDVGSATIEAELQWSLLLPQPAMPRGSRP